MNILFYAPAWPLTGNANGIISYCQNITNSLKKEGHNVFILAGKVTSQSEDNVFEVKDFISSIEKKLHSRINCVIPGHYQYWAGAKNILKSVELILENNDIDLFEVEESFGWHLHLQQRLKIPVVMRLHGPHYINGTMGGNGLGREDFYRFKREKKSFESANFVNAPCDWVKNSVKEKYDTNWLIDSTFYNPIAMLPDDLNWSAKRYIPFQILFVGRFDSHKGGDIVLQGFVKILQAFPKATLLFCGPDKGVNGPNGKVVKIQEMIDQLFDSEQKRSIKYMGLLPNEAIKKLRCQSHITIMASRNENFSYTVLEALAAGSPLVASRVGGITEAFEDGVSGLFFEGGNSEDLALKVNQVLGDEVLLNKIADGALKRCQTVLSDDVIATKALHFYEKVINFYRSQ